MITFNEKKHPWETFYLRYVQQNRIYRHLPRLSSRPFAYHYAMFRQAFARTYPWNFIRPGDVVLQAGSSKALITPTGPDILYGPSQVLLMSAIVGTEGHVYVVEPIEQNVSALLEYLAANDVRNVTVIQRGVSCQKGMVEFIVDEEHPSENIILDYSDLEKRKKVSDVYVSSFEVDTIDNIVEEYGISRLNYVNLTINGAEMDAITGSPRVMSGNVVVSFVIQQRARAMDWILELQEQGFDIHVENAPVTPQLPQFLVATAYRRQSGVAPPISNFEVTLDMGDPARIGVIPVGAGGSTGAAQ